MSSLMCHNTVDLFLQQSFCNSIVEFVGQTVCSAPIGFILLFSLAGWDKCKFIVIVTACKQHFQREFAACLVMNAATHCLQIHISESNSLIWRPAKASQNQSYA